MLNIVPCMSCKHLDKTKKRKCAAFEHIPSEILTGKNNHKTPYPGDNGIHFEPIEQGQPVNA